MHEDNLYFVPILVKAFESKEPIAAMEKALQEIVELGKLSEYNEGYEQFNKFLEIGIQSQEDKDFELVDKVLIGLASESINLAPEELEEILKKIKLNPNLMDRFAQIKKEYFSNAPLKLEIFKNENLINSTTIPQKDDELSITNIYPGNYSVRLSNGRIIWEGVIKSEDLTIDKSQPQKDYRLAAEMKGLDIAPTRTIELIKDEMYLYVYAGLEFGKFKIVVK